MNVDTIGLAKQSDSTIIVLIVVLVAAIIALIPVIKILMIAKEKQYRKEVDQQDKMLAVIQANTEVNASLKTVLEEDRKYCNECHAQQISMFRQLQDNQDIANMKLVEIRTILKKE